MTPVAAYNVDVMRDQSAQLMSAHRYTPLVILSCSKADSLYSVVSETP